MTTLQAYNEWQRSQMYLCLLIMWLSMYMPCAMIQCKTWSWYVATLSILVCACYMQIQVHMVSKLGRIAVNSLTLCMKAQISFSYLSIHKASCYSCYVTTCCFDSFTDSNQNIFPLNSNKFTICILQQWCYETLSFQTVISKPCFIR